jgi:hypothetical protein
VILRHQCPFCTSSRAKIESIRAHDIAQAFSLCVL